VELEEQLRQEAAETQAWCALARSNEASASGLHALLLRAGAGVVMLLRRGGRGGRAVDVPGEVGMQGLRRGPLCQDVAQDRAQPPRLVTL
jgi:hypothetical protein